MHELNQQQHSSIVSPPAGGSRLKKCNIKTIEFEGYLLNSIQFYSVNQFHICSICEQRSEMMRAQV